jgi:hypothetical protein
MRAMKLLLFQFVIQGRSGEEKIFEVYDFNALSSLTLGW